MKSVTVPRRSASTQLSKTPRNFAFRPQVPEISIFSPPSTPSYSPRRCCHGHRGVRRGRHWRDRGQWIQSLTIYQNYHIFGTFYLNIEFRRVFESLEEAPQRGPVTDIIIVGIVDDKAWLTAQYTYLKILFSLYFGHSSRSFFKSTNWNIIMKKTGWLFHWLTCSHNSS